MRRDEFVRLRDRAELVYAPGHEGPSLHDQGNLEAEVQSNEAA
jgi:hypothetical protein